LPELSLHFHLAVLRAEFQLSTAFFKVQAGRNAAQEAIPLKSTLAADIPYLKYRSFIEAFLDQKKAQVFVLTIKEEII
jgi:hypothetical protein